MKYSLSMLLLYIWENISLWEGVLVLKEYFTEYFTLGGCAGPERIFHLGRVCWSWKKWNIFPGPVQFYILDTAMMAWIKVIFDGFELVPTDWNSLVLTLVPPHRFLADIFPSRGSWGLKFLLGVGDIGGYLPPKRQPSRCIINEITGILNPEANHAIFA